MDDFTIGMPRQPQPPPHQKQLPASKRQGPKQAGSQRSRTNNQPHANHPTGDLCQSQENPRPRTIQQNPHQSFRPSAPYAAISPMPISQRSLDPRIIGVPQSKKLLPPTATSHTLEQFLHPSKPCATLTSPALTMQSINSLKADTTFPKSRLPEESLDLAVGLPRSGKPTLPEALFDRIADDNSSVERNLDELIALQEQTSKKIGQLWAKKALDKPEGALANTGSLKNRQFEELKDGLGTLSSTVGQLHNELQQARLEISSLRSTLLASEKNAQRVKTTHDAFVADLNSTVAAKEQECLDLRHSLGIANEEIARMAARPSTTMIAPEVSRQSSFYRHAASGPSRPGSLSSPERPRKRPRPDPDTCSIDGYEKFSNKRLSVPESIIDAVQSLVELCLAKHVNPQGARRSKACMGQRAAKFRSLYVKGIFPCLTACKECTKSKRVCVQVMDGKYVVLALEPSLRLNVKPDNEDFFLWNEQSGNIDELDWVDLK